LGHEGKCAVPHGHNYVIEITAEAGLDSIGRVIDFSVLKSLVGNWIDLYWDHGFIVNKRDQELRDAFELVRGMEHKLFVADWNPTAENMAGHLLDTICPNALKGTKVRVVKVKLWETENCFAEAVDP
jgi:6-pyruvoyltetrahydropterin/6-carboxytetrahydropterin synthase